MQDNLIDFDSKVILAAGVPYEPKLYILYVNNHITDYNTDFLDENFTDDLDQPRSSAVRLLSEVL